MRRVGAKFSTRSTHFATVTMSFYLDWCQQPEGGLFLPRCIDLGFCSGRL